MTQLRKNVLVMGGLGLAALALGLLAYYGVAKPEERETEKKEVDQKVFAAYRAGEKLTDGGTLPDPVYTGLLIKAKGDTTALENKDGSWRITEPLPAPADTTTVEQVTRSLNGSKFKDLIEENPSDTDLEKYGLKDPKFVVTAYAYVPDADGKGGDDSSRRRQVTLYGGIENTFDGSIYVRREGEKAIHSMEGGARWSLEKSTFELRNKEVLALEEAKLKRVAVKAKANHFILERDAEKSWRLVEPLAEPADAAAVAAMINALKNERAEAFPKGEDESKAKAALSTPQVDASFNDDAGQITRIRLGKGEKTFAWIERANASSVAEVPEAALTDLDKNPQELRDKTVVSFKRDDVEKVIFSGTSGPEIVAEMVATDGGPEEWRVSAPEKGPAKKWKLSSVLWNLSSLKATTLGEEKPKSWAKYGLDKPEHSASVFSRDGKLLARVDVGKAVEGKANQVYVRGKRDQVLEVDSGRLSDLPATLDDVLDKPPPLAGDAGPPLLKN